MTIFVIPSVEMEYLSALHQNIQLFVFLPPGVVKDIVSAFAET
jgi:hypothetical protein